MHEFSGCMYVHTHLSPALHLKIVSASLVTLKGMLIRELWKPRLMTEVTPGYIGISPVILQVNCLCGITSTAGTIMGEKRSRLSAR